MKAYFEGFQCCENTSGVVAAPTSPIPPARASGAMESEGMAEYKGFKLESHLSTTSVLWALALPQAAAPSNEMMMSFFFIRNFIVVLLFNRVLSYNHEPNTLSFRPQGRNLSSSPCEISHFTLRFLTSFEMTGTPRNGGTFHTASRDDGSAARWKGNAKL